MDRPQTKLLLVDVPKRRWWLLPVKVLGWMSLTGSTAAAVGVTVAHLVFGAGLPELPTASAYAPPVVSEAYSADGVLAGEFFLERRKVVPYDRIPKRLVQAFIASEDSNFFDHPGVDVLGTARAAWKTALRKVTGRGSVQGGSTLTQQTAKAVLISAEGYESATAKTLRRKIREAILARRLEAALTKEEILYLYLNTVYLGHHSYGVQSAAENYFRKNVHELTLAQMALIAGLPQAPSKYSPFVKPEAARRRRHYVLGRMLTEGMISQAEHDEADADEVTAYPVEDVFREFAPYFTEEVRRSVVSRYGNTALLTGGLTIFTTMDSERQRAAQEAVLNGLFTVDKRQGFRGPLMHLSTKEELRQFQLKSRAVIGDGPLEQGRLYVGVVTKLSGDGIWADVDVGGRHARLPLWGMRWARPVNAEQYYPSALLQRVDSALHENDVVVVRVVEKKQLYDDKEQYQARLESEVDESTTLVRLEQEPELQSAIVSIDPHRQYLVAMVGGYDFDANEYNRAFQACRQPGSSFKPLVYAAAIEQLKWTEATVIVDSPLVYDDPGNENRWKPSNYSEDFAGDVLLRTALINSMNIPAVKTFIAVGIPAMATWTKQLGLSTPMNPDFSAALGSSCVLPYELAQVYATMNRGGVQRPTYFVRKIEDRSGAVVEDHTALDDAWATLHDRIAAGYARMYQPGKRVMEQETAFLITDLMRGVVLEGTGAPAQKLGKPAAGKTGTTNDSFDAWFSGFTRDLVTTAWVGYDLNPHPLGRYETGGRAALPIWLAYMKRALDGRDQPEFDAPPGADLVRLQIDEKTGRLAPGGGKGTKAMWFKRGTEPTEVKVEQGGVDPNQFLMQ